MLIHIAVLLNRPESRLGEGHAEKQKRASTGELDLLPQNGESQKKLLKAVREFRGYIEAKQNFIPKIMGIVTGTQRRFQRPSRSPR
jgi:hypothetical protein